MSLRDKLLPPEVRKQMSQAPSMSVELILQAVKSQLPWLHWPAHRDVSSSGLSSSCSELQTYTSSSPLGTPT